MDPKVWGPSYWNVLHYSALNANTRDKRYTYIQFVENLPSMIPCNACREHLKQNLIKYPVRNYAINEMSLFEWSWMLHNLVNILIKKPEYMRLTYEQAVEKYNVKAADGTCSLGDCGNTDFVPVQNQSQNNVVIVNKEMPRKLFRPVFMPRR